MARAARAASTSMLDAAPERKNKALREMAAGIIAGREAILKANREDVSAARKAGLKAALIDRLRLDERRLSGMADGLKAIAELPDPAGGIIKRIHRPNGLLIKKVRVPIGVILVIYESRPNVTSDCAGLCLKSGNSVILRGGGEALRSNLAIGKILQEALKKNGLPLGLVNIVAVAGRAAVDALLKLEGEIDLVIPRGGEGLIRKVAGSSRIPVIKHYKGVCHTYVDEEADLNMAQKICFNAKVQRPGVCNAMETMLVHRGVAQRFLPGMLKEFKQAGVKIRGCPLTYRISRGSISKARERDYYTEYLDLELSLKVVGDIDEAVRHINHYGTHHSDSIVTDGRAAAEKFLRLVDSACVYHNASTRFTDGCQFGMGAEIGISTDKLHCRGPMALEELTTYKYMIYGGGQIRT